MQTKTLEDTRQTDRRTIDRQTDTLDKTDRDTRQDGHILDSH